MNLNDMESEKVFFISLAFVIVALVFAITYYKVETNKERVELLKTGNLEECPVYNNYGNIEEIVLVKKCDGSITFRKD